MYVCACMYVCMCSWVKEFLSDGSCGLRELVHYMMFRYHLELKYVVTCLYVYMYACVCHVNVV